MPKKPSSLHDELAEAVLAVLANRRQKPTRTEVLMAAALVGGLVIQRLQASGRLQ